MLTALLIVVGLMSCALLFVGIFVWSSVWPKYNLSYMWCATFHKNHRVDLSYPGVSRYDTPVTIRKVHCNKCGLDWSNQ